MGSSTSLQRLLSIMKQLRDPQTGCEWDRVQTFDTITPFTLEETYEVLEAIANRDFTELRSELGDLLYQIVFYAEMAQEQGHFDFSDVCEAISDKLVHRHPHIFSDEKTRPNWELTKKRERELKSQTSALDDLPVALPALMKADKIQRRVAAVGFDWDTLGPVVGKVYEELDEVMNEAKQAVIDNDKLQEEIGDLLFATVNLSRHLGQNAESALAVANRKFERRFRYVEQLITEQGISMEEASLEQMEAAWQQVKMSEKKEP